MNDLIFSGKYGLERENLRVDMEGKPAMTPHPFTSQYIDRDFCENQTELITPVCGSTDRLFSVLSDTDRKIRETLAGNGEMLWFYSNPPLLPAGYEVPVAHFSGKRAEKEKYRHALAARYGKKIMLYSGIHFNFSFDNAYIKALYDKEKPDISFFDFKNDLYLRVFKNTFIRSWLFVVLTAASPVCDVTFCDTTRNIASFRNSDLGYWNKKLPILDYSSLCAYMERTESLVDSGELISADEIYVPVRIKPKGAYSSEALSRDGIDHLELRMFDVNPLSRQGIFRDDVEFAHLFLIYMLSFTDFELTPALQKIAIDNHMAASTDDIGNTLLDIGGKKISAKDAALAFLDNMSAYFGDTAISDVISLQKRKLTQHKRYCEIIRPLLAKDYGKSVFDLSLRHRDGLMPE